MDSKELLAQIRKIPSFYAILSVLIILPFTGILHDHLLLYLEKIVGHVTLSLGLVLEIRNLLSIAHGIPVVGASSANLSETLSEVAQYLSWSDMIITFQVILLKLSDTVLFKVLLLIGAVGMFLPSYRSLSFKVLVILLLINPGLPAYVSINKFISEEMTLNDGSDLHNQIDEVHKKYQEKEEERKKKEAARDQRQLDEAEAKGKDHISGLKKIEDKIADTTTRVADKIGEGIAEGIAIVKSALKDLIIKSINLVVTVAIQFLLLPFLFLYGLVAFFKRITSKDITEDFLKRTAVGLFIGVLVGLATVLFGKRTEASGELSEPDKPTSEASAPVLGIDVSHHQGAVDWEEIKNAGISFVYAKATESSHFVDPRFEENWSAIKAAGMIRGAYHFYMAGEDPKKQADLFIKTVGKIEKGEMPPMLDLEEAGMKPGIDPSAYQRNVFQWLDIVEKAFGRKPIIYTDHPYGSTYLVDPKFGDYGLWIADWEKRAEPRIPPAWKGKWTIWQRSDRGTFMGAAGDVDHDLFNGSREDLMELVNR